MFYVAGYDERNDIISVMDTGDGKTENYSTGEMCKLLKSSKKLQIHGLTETSNGKLLVKEYNPEVFKTFVDDLVEKLGGTILRHSWTSQNCLIEDLGRWSTVMGTSQSFLQPVSVRDIEWQIRAVFMQYGLAISYKIVGQKQIFLWASELNSRK